MFSNSPIPRWRKQNNNYFLEASKCNKCNKIHFPSCYICICSSKKFCPITLSGKGKLLTFTKVTTPPKAFSNMAPYCIGLVELEEGIKVTTQIVDIKFEDIKISMPVYATFRKLYNCGKTGIINYGIKFRPL